MVAGTSARWYGAAATFLVLLADQLTKGFVRTAGEGAVFFASRWLNVIHARNPGISFGLFNGGQPWQVFAIGMVVGCLGFWLFLQYWRSGSRGLSVCYGFVLGGAVGNLLDRARYGAVTDFLDFHITDFHVPFFGWYIPDWHWPAFNVADSAIVVGCVLILFCAGLTSGGRVRRG